MENNVNMVMVEKVAYDCMSEDALRFRILEENYRTHRWGIERCVAAAIFDCEPGCDMPPEKEDNADA